MNQSTTLAQQLCRFITTAERPDQIKACFDFCKEYFSAFPLVVTDYVSNGIPSLVISTQKTLTPDVLLLGHIDTVPGDQSLFQGTIEGNRLKGRGTLDMKAFVATSLIVLRELLEEGYAGNAAIMLVSDEESGSINGTRYLVNDIGYRPKVVLVPDDGEQINRIVTQTKRILQIRFTALGREAHGARPWAGINAIALLTETYSNLQKFIPPRLTAPTDLWINTTNLGIIEGGTAPNEVPKDASMVVDIRTTSETPRETVIGWVEKSLLPGVTFQIISEGVPTNMPLENPYLQKYSDILQTVTGKEVEYIKNGGGTDGRYFVSKDIPIIVNQGNGGNCQSDEESIELNSLETLIKVQKEFIKSLA